MEGEFRVWWPRREPVGDVEGPASVLVEAAEWPRAWPIPRGAPAVCILLKNVRMPERRSGEVGGEVVGLVLVVVVVPLAAIPVCNGCGDDDDEDDDVNAARSVLVADGWDSTAAGGFCNCGIIVGSATSKYGGASPRSSSSAVVVFVFVVGLISPSDSSSECGTS